MDEESVLAPEAGPEVAATEQVASPETEGQVESPAADMPPEGDAEEKKSNAAKRRERDRAYKEQLQQDRDAALKEAADLKARHDRILSAGAAEKAPSETDYPDPLEYVAAKAVWAAQQQLTARDAKDVSEAEQAARQRAEEIDRQEQAIIAQAWTAQTAEAKTRYADFEAVAFRPDMPLSDAMVDLIRTSDQGADVAYFLGKNMAVASEIAKLKPVEAARAIGRIEASLSLPKPRTETNAPAPITPVRGAASVTRQPDKMSYAEFVKYRESGGKIG